MAGHARPGSLGISGYAEDIDTGTSPRVRMPAPGPVGAVGPPDTAIDADTRTLAAIAYGEASTADVFEEMAAIANVLVRQQKARGFATISGFVKRDRTFAFAAHDGNPRFVKFTKAKPADILKDAGMNAAMRAARNALAANGVDYSGGAYFWDGADIKSNYGNHAKVLGGIHITDPSHNVYGIEDKDMPGEGWWLDRHGKETKSRGKYDYKYESTAGHGGTIFWKYSDDFIKATGNKPYQ